MRRRWGGFRILKEDGLLGIRCSQSEEGIQNGGGKGLFSPLLPLFYGGNKIYQKGRRRRAWQRRFARLRPRYPLTLMDGGEYCTKGAGKEGALFPGKGFAFGYDRGTRHTCFIRKGGSRTVLSQSMPHTCISKEGCTQFPTKDCHPLFPLRKGEIFPSFL